MFRIIFILIFITLFGTTIFGQNEPGCPMITIQSPKDVINDDEMKFSLKFDDNIIALNLNYEWKTDFGKIIDGKNDQKIIVDVSEIEDTVVSATVKIIGLPANCKDEFSATGIVARIKDYFPLSPIGDVSKNEVRAEIDNLFIRLQNDSATTGYLINYGSKKEVKKREKLIEDHIKKRAFDRSRIVFLTGRKEAVIRTEVYILPKGVSPPTP